MKNFNLIERLLSNSHEKQSPQRFARYAAMLILFLSCVTHAWATDRDVFIDLTGAPSWYTNPEVNHGTGSTYYVKSASSTNITGIYKVTIPDTDNWEVCRDGGYNKLAWQAYDNGKNMVKVNKDGNGGDASAIIGLVQGGKIYFDNSKTKWTGTIQFVIGHSSYSRTYTMTKKAGTELCYLSLDDETYKQWSDATYYAVISTVTKVADGAWGSSSLSTKAPSYRTAIYSGPYSLDANSQYLITTSSGAATGATITIDYKSAYTAMNYTQTVTLCTKAYGAASYTANTSSLTSLNFTAYKLDGIGSVTTQQTNNMNGSTGVASGDACQAAITTINVGDAPASWVYDGIYPAMNSGSQVSDDQEFTYYPTAATNYYVRFHEVHDPSVGLAASSSYLTTTSGLRALTGEAITLTATATYTAGSPVYYTYEYSTNGGLTWNSIASKVTNTSKTFTPETTGDYKFRVTLPSEIGTPSAVTNVHVTEMYTIKVKKNASWTPNKLYIWNASSEIKQYGAFPGETGHFTNKGKWYEFELNSDFDSFIISASDHNSNHTTDVNSVTSDGCYAIGGTTGTSCSVSSDDCPTAPTVTLTTTVRQNQITLKGQITDYGNDGSSASDMEEVGFYVGATKHTAVCDDDGYFYKTVTGLTANTQYSIYAFATNAGGTGVSATATPTTLATTATHKLKVQVPNSVVPYVYTYCDNDACGANSLQNAAFPGQAATRIVDGVSNDWYEFDIHDQYDKFIIAVNAEDKKQTANQTNPREDICRWYNNGAASQGDRYGTTDCPVTETSLYIGDKDAAAASHTYYTMSGTTTMSKTVSLAANHAYEFKVVYNAEYYGIASKTINREGKTNNVINAGTSSAGAAYIYLNTDFAGDYTITFNESTKAITVTYPTAYVVTYSKSIVGTDNSTTAAPSAAYTTGATAVTSGDLVPNGAGVTFTAAEAGSGYTWKGWYTVENPSADYTANRVATTAEYATTISAATTIYAVYAEDMHTVTVTAGAHGSITTPAGGSGSEVSVGIATTADIVTTNADYGYYFSGWTVEEGTAFFGDASAKSTTVRATTAATIKANYVSHWTIAGGDSETGGDGADAMGDWNVYANGIEDFAQDGNKDWIGHIDIDLPANSTFYFKVRDLDDGSAWYGNSGEMTYGNHTNWTMTSGSSNCRITTAGKGTYTFTWNETQKKLTVTYPTSYTVTYNVSTFYDNDNDHAYDNTTGGSISYKKDNDSIELVSGKYVVAGGTMTFKATPASGYRFAGWYQNQACSMEYTDGSDGADIDDGVLTLTILDDENNKTVYAKFTENMTTVNFASTHGHVVISGVTETSANVGVHTTCTLTPVADWGYYFAGWEKTAGTEYAIDVDEDDEDDAETVLSGNGNIVTSGQTLTAKFVELDKVYLYNMGWGATLDRLWPTDGDNHIYAYFAVQEESSCPKSANTDDPYYIQQMATEDIVTMYAYVPRAVTRNLNAGTYGDNERIAFSNHQFEKNYKFHQYEAIYWGSYRQILNEFIPQVNDYKTLNETKVYNGYWKKHDPKIGDEAGYYLKHRTGTNTYSDFTNGTDPIFKYISDNMIQCKLRIDNSEDANNYYMIHSAGGVKYTTAEWPQDADAPTITSSNCLNVGITENQINDSKFLIKQTSQGYYTLTMTFSSDTMYLKVDYPVAVGDYRLEHSYTVDAVTKKTYSGTLKHDDDDKAAFTSMYLNMDAGTKSLVMQTCTSINGSGNPVWSSGVDVTGFNTTNFKDGKGVYSFRISWVGNAVGADVTSATPDIIALYDGEYYIKTDYALGGWTNWIMNDMEKNTINFTKSDPKTFDYYYAAWVSSETGDRNVKCVVGNIYNEALCDTLIGDEILGEVWDAKEGKNVPRQYLAYDASVRFSYNSYTNELKRAYLNGSNDGETDYMYLQGTSESTSRILDYSTGSTFTDNKVKFKDRGNWIYEIDIKAEEGARVRLISNYRFSDADHLQYYKGSDGDWGTSTTEQILGGSNNTTNHPIRIVYDFKTNHLISAWLAGGEEGATRAINTNAMIIRDHQEQASQITFANPNDKLTEVDTVYSVMKFNKWTINNKSRADGHANLDPALSQYERDLFWISFPYDVKLSDVFGFGEYMKHWAIQYYDGRGRAKNGYWAESKPNWKFIPANKKDTILHAFEGYVLALDLDELGLSSKVWQLVEDVYLYFPSNGPARTIVQQDTTVAIDTVGYHCNIDWYHKNDGSGETTGLPASYDRRFRDSHWHCIGVPSYHDVSHGIMSGDYWIDSDENDTVDMPNPDKYDGEISAWETQTIPYFYEWNMKNNQLYAKSNRGDTTFKAMYAYLVQYAKPQITWSAVTISPKPASVVERRKARLADDHFSEFNLHLMRNDQILDHTYVRLTDNEHATADFEFDQDMCKELQNGVGIYTLIDELEVAGNSLPLNTTGTTIVPVGVTIAANGLYTFSMPEGTEGIGVILVDNITGTRTNLALTNYEVSLTQGKIDNRFWLEISPIAQTPTDIENTGAGVQDNVRKVVVDGIMYIVKEGVVYDAQGNRVK